MVDPPVTEEVLIVPSRRRERIPDREPGLVDVLRFFGSMLVRPRPGSVKAVEVEAE